MTRTTIFFILIFLCSSCNKDDDREFRPTDSVGSQSISIIEDVINEEKVVVVGSGSREFIQAFYREIDGQLVNFVPTQKGLPTVMEDDLGNSYDIFGNVMEGPNDGSKLKKLNTGMAFWFAIAAQYPEMELYQRESIMANVPIVGGGEWLVSSLWLAQGAGFDAIASLQEPKFIEYNVRNVDPSFGFFIEDDERVIVVYHNDKTKSYPISILNWHEIINDEIDGLTYSVTYCPLTGTSKVWERKATTTYGVSGLLYNSNLISFDRETKSFWTQLDARCVFGDRKYEVRPLLSFIETTWSTWKTFDREPMVMTFETGITRDYKEYPYGDYENDHDIIAYPIAFDDTRLPRKERVFYIIINGKAKAYRYSDF